MNQDILVANLYLIYTIIRVMQSEKLKLMLENLNAWNNWVDYEKNPLIRPEAPEWIIADPTFLPPNESPDGNWHLFAHGILYGIYHYTSSDGLNWKNTRDIIPNGLRPFLFKEDDIYYLLYEKTFAKLLGNIVMLKSYDLFQWTNSTVILSPTYHWEGFFSRRVGNPCLVKSNDNYFLFYSAGGYLLWDCLLLEPHNIGLAQATNIKGPYRKLEAPIITPSNTHRYRNLASGAIKVIKINNLWVGFNNGIYKDHKGRSRSSILLLGSKDGINWYDIFDYPIIAPSKGWKKSFVYQLDVRKINDTYMIYYNAREGCINGWEGIGLATLNLK